jgi:hypothetical protein
MASVPRRPRWVAVRPSWPAGLAPLVRPPPDGRCARHATPCSGAARCGQGGKTPDIPGPPTMPLVAVTLHARCVHSARRVDRDAGSLAERGALRRAQQSGNCGGPRRDRPEGTSVGTGRSHSESCRPAGNSLDPVTPAARRAERGPRSAVGAQSAPSHITAFLVGNLNSQASSSTFPPAAAVLIVTVRSAQNRVR